ncbi:hypothetical protein ABIF83_004527 [Bradyrhizobium ottawaense]
MVDFTGFADGLESCILLGLLHSASKGLKFGKLRKKRLSTLAQDNAVVRPIMFTHCTPPKFEEFSHSASSSELVELPTLHSRKWDDSSSSAKCSQHSASARSFHLFMLLYAAC